MKKLTQEEFITKANLIHNNKYDYSLVEYINNRLKIKIICPKHGIFEQTPAQHLRKRGCSQCGVSIVKKFKNQKHKEIFFEKAPLIHNNKYNYNLVQYTRSIDKVKIICPNHGIFYQSPHNHLQGHGCQKCLHSKGEIQIKKLLEENNIVFTPQKTFDDCKGRKRKLPFDFYLPDYNVIIEFDGAQHFNGWNGNKNSLNESKINDSIKDTYCIANNIPLIRIRYDEDIEQRVLELIKSLK